VRLLIVSDLHTEFHADQGRAMIASLGKADVLVCAGDLSNADGIWDALALALDAYEHVIFVFGNHEFYGSSLDAVRTKVRRFQEWFEGHPENRGRLHVLDNSTCEIEGRRFVGTTLWMRRQPGIEYLHGHLNDFYMIERAETELYRENVKSLAFLKRTVGPDDVVVTHHLPSPRSVHPMYADSDLNCFFLCDVEDLITERQPRLWVHGHTHLSADYEIGRTRVLCNPFGYALKEENPQFDSRLTVEI